MCLLPQRPPKESPPTLQAAPLESDILTFHYVIRGAEGTPYDGGYYHGQLRFPSEYPMKPPAVLMITPNGRFEVNQRLCVFFFLRPPETRRGKYPNTQP